MADVFVPSSHVPLPDVEKVKQRFVGQKIDTLPTPAVLIDKSKMISNIEKMAKAVSNWQCLFRAHIKTHKTREGTAYQLSHSTNRAIIVSTLAEAWGVVHSGLIEDGTVYDVSVQVYALSFAFLVLTTACLQILYGIPVSINKIQELLLLRQTIQSKSTSADLKLLVDNVDQVDSLQAALEKQEKSSNPISIFIKIDASYHRAGLTVSSPALVELVKRIGQSSQVAVWGVYCHAGNSYGSTSFSKASTFLTEELQCTNEAIQLVDKVLANGEGSFQKRHRSPLVLSVGSTPTAHAASGVPTNSVLQRLKTELKGDLELHAGNYPFLDLQQLATGAVPAIEGISAIERCSMTVLASIISVYPGRGEAEETDPSTIRDNESETLATLGDEALCDAGGIALSKDTGQLPGFGHVVSPLHFVGWQVGRVAQEHGVMTIRKGGSAQWSQEWGGSPSPSLAAALNAATSMVRVGDKVQIVPQHACMVAAAHPWLYIYDSSLGQETPTVIDIWISWKGW